MEVPPPPYDEAVSDKGGKHRELNCEDYHDPDSGPRPDQYSAMGWFEKQGWKTKWPLHYAAMKGDVISIIRLVQREKIPPDQKMTVWFDSEPVGWAASFGQLGALRCLIDLGAYPFTKNKAGNDTIDDAKREKHDKCLKFLVEYKRTNNTMAAITSAAGSSSGNIPTAPYEPPASARMIKAEDYIETGTGPHCHQRMAFGWFESRGWVPRFPVHYAAMKGDVASIIDLVLNKHHRPDEIMTDWFDSEPVGWASSLGQLGALRCLIDLGAYPFKINKAGFNALTDAQREKHRKCIAFLEEYQRSGDVRAAKEASNMAPEDCCCRIL